MKNLDFWIFRFFISIFFWIFIFVDFFWIFWIFSFFFDFFGLFGFLVFFFFYFFFVFLDLFFWRVGVLDLCILDPSTCGYLDTSNCISVYRKCQGEIILASI